MPRLRSAQHAFTKGVATVSVFACSLWRPRLLHIDHEYLTGGLTIIGLGR